MAYLLKIQLNNPIAKPYYINHTHAYHDDARIDLIVPENITVPAKALGFKINLFVSLEMIDRHTKENVSYYLYGRSSLSNTPLRLSCAVGIIDAGFRGNLFCIVDNLSDKPYFIQKGDRLIQVCSPTLKSIHVLIAKNLSQGSRENNGIGSSNLFYHIAKL